ncbi:hypothetical protein [Tautonia marina]|uniref:hypothetical protein n=1 Tax=Tautonia marina TaxID=2653855 RepID=UPI0012608514|nr:hypothetical protein [Tautonia marina]
MPLEGADDRPESFPHATSTQEGLEPSEPKAWRVLRPPDPFSQEMDLEASEPRSDGWGEEERVGGEWTFDNAAAMNRGQCPDPGIVADAAIGRFKVNRMEEARKDASQIGRGLGLPKRCAGDRGDQGE